MNRSDVRDALEQIIELLSQIGYEDRATWLAERLNLINDPNIDPEDLQQVRQELHGTVPHMGGLLDLNPRPVPSSKLTRLEAKSRLDELAGRLYRLTE
jgi:hypothetical protein